MLITDHFLERVHTQKDLGVYVDSKLNFSVHVNEILKKANHMLGNCKDLHPQTKISLYQTLIRPSLDFGSVIYNSISLVHINRIERFHHRFMRFVSYNQTESINLDKCLSPKLHRAFLDLSFFIILYIVILIVESV